VADNIAVTAGTGTNIAADDIGAGLLVQRVKTTWGPDGTANDADVATGKPLPVQVRSATGLIPIGEPTDAAATATDTTSVTGISLWKQISKTLQATVSAASTALFSKITDGTNTAAVKAASTAPAATDPALVVAMSPNSVNANGSAAAANSAPVTASTEDVARVGIITETAPASDTASSGLNGRLQRIAQNITTMIAATLKVAGVVAHDGVDSGNPIKVGGRARSSEIAAVSSDDRTDFLTDLVGKLIVLPYANPENFVSGAITSAMTGTTSTSLIAAPAAGLRNYITQVTVSNAHATVGTDIILQDGSGGTTLYTIPAAAVYGGAVITFPTPLRQPTTATALFCANVTTGASTKVSASGYKGA
jgi:hypothetical protein